MTNIECPWCHKVNECEVWELSSGTRYDDWECEHCGKYFSFDFEIDIEYSIADVRKVEVSE